MSNYTVITYDFDGRGVSHQWESKAHLNFLLADEGIMDVILMDDADGQSMTMKDDGKIVKRPKWEAAPVPERD